MRAFLVVAAALLVTLGARADEPSPAADFAAANERMLAGDAAGAIALYQHLESRGVEAADLQYNLGVALAKSDRTLDAIIAWERALRLDPSHADARANLAAIRQRLPARAAAAADGEASASAVDAIESVIAPLPRDAVAFALVVTLTVLCLLLALRRMGIARGRGVGALAIVMALATVLLAVVVAGHEVVAHDGRAVVRTAGALKEGANPRFGDVAAIAAGERVRVLREEASWVEVQATDGVTGWLAASAVLRL